MRKCYFCEKREDETELFNVINGNDVVNSCDLCLRRENLPIVKRPDDYQLKESEKSYSVYERLSRMAGLPQKPKEKREEYTPKGLTLDKLRKPVDYNKRTLREGHVIISSKGIDVIDNFNWFIQTSRRRAKLSQKQLAEAIGEEEEKIIIIEQGNFPENAEKLLLALESFLKIRLLKGTPEKKEEITIKPKPIEREEWSYSEIKEEPIFVREKTEEKTKSSYILKVDREKIKDLTIADLQKMKKAKEILEKEKISEFTNKEETLEEDKYRRNLQKKAERDMNMKEIDDMIWRRSKKDKIKKEEKKEDLEVSQDVEEIIEEVEEEKKENEGFFSNFKKKIRKLTKRKKLTQEEIDKIIEEQDKE